MAHQARDHEQRLAGLGQPAAERTAQASHNPGSPASEIKLRIRRLPASISIEVSDRGSGMTESVLASALVPFYSTKRGGTGLGLALVREIAEPHGGRVALANREGDGLNVTITFPQ